MKKYIIITSLILLCIPFVLIKTVYPFFRFGMFAEPIKTTAQTESFKVYYETATGQKQVFDGTAIGLSKTVYGNMMRNYYYKKKASELLEKTATVSKNEAITWEMWRFTQQDSVLVEQWKP